MDESDIYDIVIQWINSVLSFNKLLSRFVNLSDCLEQRCRCEKLCLNTIFSTSEMASSLTINPY